MFCLSEMTFVFQGGVGDSVSLTAYITAALLELDVSVKVRLPPPPP